MTDSDNNLSHLSVLPTETLLYIFTFLSAKQLIKCRRVCLRWKNIIDELTRKDALWWRYCKHDFNDIYKVARLKARPGLLWFNIYRSLSLWPKLASAREIRDEFASASTYIDEIKSFEILRDGVMGVHTRRAIVYYDTGTFERSKRGDITGDYLYYSENDDTILFMSYHAHLFIVRKLVRTPNYLKSVTFTMIKLYLLVDRDVYYVTLDDEIYVCNLDDRYLQNKFIARLEDSIMTLGYSKNRLNVLTVQRNIFTIYKQEPILISILGPTSNILHELRQYNLLEQLDWRIYFQWMFVLNHTIPQGPLEDIITVRSYGDMIFVGSKWGVFRIYYAPHSSELDIFNTEPVKQYNFMERNDCPVLTTCPIIQIDVLEAEEGHTIIVAMPKKIAVLDFVHNFKRTASVAMLSYRDVEKVKMIKIDNNV